MNFKININKIYGLMSDKTRIALQLAYQEAERAGHKHIAPEHLLVGIMKERSNSAAIVLDHNGITLRLVRDECGINEVGKKPFFATGQTFQIFAS